MKTDQKAEDIRLMQKIIDYVATDSGSPADFKQTGDTALARLVAGDYA